MSPRARRLAIGVALLVAALFAGRWTADLLAERWWALSLSSAAASAVTRWRLLGLALDVLAITTAATWFAVQAVLVARAIASVQVARQVGDLQLREAVPTRLLIAGAVATGVLLGLITGAGGREWRVPVALAWQGVHYGIADPLLGEDIGTFVAQLPLWDVLHRFAILLVVLGFAFVAMLYAGIGAVRRDGTALVAHPYARRHLGLLLGGVALVISVGYLLSPFHFVSNGAQLISPDGALTRIRSAQIMAGVALSTGVLSLLWIRRGRHALLAGGWSVLAIGALVERVVVPAVTEQATPPAGSEEVITRFDALAWHLAVTEGVPAADTLPPAPSVWNRSLLSRYVDGNGGTLLAATQAVVTLDDRPTPAWLVAASVLGDSTRIDLLAIEEGLRSPPGSPVSLHPALAPPTRPVWRSLGDARVLPGASAWRQVSSGVAVNGMLRRLVLAWSRQSARLLTLEGATMIDWHDDPTARVTALLPMLSWLTAEVTLDGERPFWVVQGLLPIDRFPVASRTTWLGEPVGGLVPAMVATVDPVSGETRFFLDPAADSAAAAWARFTNGLVSPASDIPPAIRQSLRYSGDWLEPQLRILESEEWRLGKRPGRVTPAGIPGRSVPIWVDGSRPGRQAVFEDPERRTLSALVTAVRRNGNPQLVIDRYEARGSAVENGRELERLWARMVPLMHVRDSARAAGDTVEVGPVHWFLGSGGLAAWQPLFSVPARGAPSLLWISTSLGPSLGGGRSMAEAWQALRLGGGGIPTIPPGSDAATIARARLWMLRADSALARGDLTAFGRAIEELRAVLRP